LQKAKDLGKKDFILDEFITENKGKTNGKSINVNNTPYKESVESEKLKR
jgi:hypothetical protein